MTNEELEKVSQRVAEIVVEKIRLMQAEFDDEYQANLDRIREREELHEHISFAEANEYLLAELRDELSRAIEEEDYTKAAKLRNQIADIEGR